MQHQGGEPDTGASLLLLFPTEGLPHHLSTDDREECERDPGEEPRDPGEQVEHGMHKKPTEDRHCRLEEGEDPRDHALPAPMHVGIGHAVRKRDRKGIHRKAEAEENAIEEKHKIEIHGTSRISTKKTHMPKEVLRIWVLHFKASRAFAGMSTCCACACYSPIG